jgi:hypothetical protein
VFAEQWRTALQTLSAPPVPAITAYAPTVTSVAPSAGTGLSTVFTASFADGNGATDVNTVSLSIQSGSTANACYVNINRASGAIQLRNDADSAWTGGLTIGQAATLSNSRCSVTGSGASLTANGNALALTIPVAFTNSFAGTRDVMLSVNDAGGLTSSWQKAGSWTVPAVIVPPTPPTFLSLSPATGAGSSATFVTTFQDVNGANEIGRALILVNKNLSSAGGCYIFIYADTRQYYMLNNAGTGWLGPVTMGSGSVSNGNCNIGSASSVSVSGTSMSITLPIQFGSGFAGAKTIWTSVGDLAGTFTSWRTGGTFNVQ